MNVLLKIGHKLLIAAAFILMWLYAINFLNAAITGISFLEDLSLATNRIINITFFLISLTLNTILIVVLLIPHRSTASSK